MFAIIRNGLAFVGLLALLGGIISFATAQQGNTDQSGFNLMAEMTAIKELDPKAVQVYSQMWQKLKDTKNSAAASVWKVPLSEGVSWQEAEESMRLIANEHNMRAVGELPLSEQVELETGEEQRFLKIYQFCDPQTAMQMVNHHDAFSAYMPCRIAMVEDKQGNFNLYALNMDLMIYGGAPLPPELLKEAERVKSIILDIMNRSAIGDF